MEKKITLLIAILVCIVSVAGVLAGDSKKIPAVISLDSMSERYEPVIFTHERHVAIAGNCGTCHHEHGDNGSLPCKNCHSLSSSIFKTSVVSGFGSCRNCHDTSTPETPGIPGLKAAYHNQCFKCHRGIAGIGLDPKACNVLCHSVKEKMMGMKR